MGVYERLGVRPVINAGGMLTMAGGSLMARPVLEAMAEAATTFVDMNEFHVAAGRRIAELIGVEAAHVTSGAACSLMLATAACMTGSDPARIRQLPDTVGLRDEIVIQKSHRFLYDQAFLVSGAKLREAGDAHGCGTEEIEALIGPQTAALVHIVSPRHGPRSLSVRQMAAVAHAHELPLIVDAATTLPSSRVGCAKF